MAPEPVLGTIDVTGAQGQPLAVAVKPGAKPLFSDAPSERVPDCRTCQRADGPCRNDDPELKLSPCGHEPRKGNHHLGRNWWKEFSRKVRAATPTYQGAR